MGLLVCPGGAGAGCWHGCAGVARLWPGGEDGARTLRVLGAASRAPCQLWDTALRTCCPYPQHPHTPPVHSFYKPVPPSLPRLWPSHLWQPVVPPPRRSASSPGPQWAGTPLSLPNWGAERGDLVFTGSVAISFPSMQTGRRTQGTTPSGCPLPSLAPSLPSKASKFPVSFHHPRWNVMGVGTVLHPLYSPCMDPRWGAESSAQRGDGRGSKPD